MPWHHIKDPKDHQLDELAERYHLHPLHIEDCRTRRQRVKADETPDYVFVILKAVDKKPDSELDFSDLDIFVGADFCITVEEADCQAIAGAVKSAKQLADPERPDQIFYRLIDAIVDSYLPVIDDINERIDDTEEIVLARPSPEAVQQILGLKRSLIGLRRVLVNTREVGVQIQRQSGNLISQDLAPFFRDVYDHIIGSLDLVETQRDLLSGTLDVYLSSLANRTNEVMKVLTVLSTIALPSIVISGIYGMNLKGIPYLESPHAMWIVGCLMIGTTVALLAFLKKFGWF